MERFFRLPATLFFLLLATASLLAQQDDNGLLYFPPELTVGIGTDPNWWFRRAEYGNTLSEEEDPEKMPPLKDHLVLTVQEREAKLPWFLPMIFFDQGSYSIPPRYRQFNGTGATADYVDTGRIDRSQYREASYALVKYYDILNDLGYRLAGSPAITIALEGGYSTEPGEDPALATERAQVVREYLVNIWQIAPERITLLPPRRMCDSAANIFKQEEARRVMIYSDDQALFRPIPYRLTFLNLDRLLVGLQINPRMPPEDVAGIDLIIASDEDILSRTSVPVSPDSASYNLLALWAIPRYPEKLGKTLSVQTFVRTTDGRVRPSNAVTIPIIIRKQEEEASDEPTEISGEKREEELTAATADETITGDAAAWPNPYELQYTCRLPFFEASDTALSRIQMDRLRHVADSVAQRMAAWPESRWQIIVNGRMDAAEFPDVENAELAAKSAAYRSVQGYFADLMTDPTLRFSLFFFPLTPTQAPGKNWDALTDGISRTLYGDRATEITEAVNSMRDALTAGRWADTSDHRIAEFYGGRAGETIRYFSGRLNMERFDTISLFDNLLSLYSAPFTYTPEERFYNRWVTISFELSYNYQTELWNKRFGVEEEGDEEEAYEEAVEDTNIPEEEIEEEDVEDHSDEESGDEEGSEGNEKEKRGASDAG